MKKSPIRRISSKQAKRQREWTKIGIEVAEEQGWCCGRCGRYFGFFGEFGLHPHHKVWRSDTRNDTKENCEVIGYLCHGREHGTDIREG